MNTLGKTLVFLNLLFALVVGGFLAYDFSVRNNWRKAHDDLLDELKVSRTNTDRLHQENSQIVKEKTEVEAKLKTAQENSTKDAKKAKADILKLEAMYANAADLVKPLEIKYVLAIEETKKVIEENKALAKALAKREQDLDKLAVENNRLFAERQAADNDRAIVQTRADSLFERVRELEIKIARGLVGPTGTTVNAGFRGGPTVSDPNKPNPPPGMLKGIIEEVHASDKELVQVSFGSDVGLNVDHTLEVYRLKPKAEYLGMIRIVETTPHRAVGRLVRTNVGLPPPSLRIGDEVASRIQPR